MITTQSTYMRVLPGIGIYNDKLDLENEVGPYYLPISVESIPREENATASLQSGANTLREDSLDHQFATGSNSLPRQGLELRRKLLGEKSEGKITFEGNTASIPVKHTEKSSTIASGSYQYFLINESCHNDSDTADLEKRNIPREFSAAANKRTEQKREQIVPIVGNLTEPYREEAEAPESKVFRSRIREHTGKSREIRGDSYVSRTRSYLERDGVDNLTGYNRRRLDQLEKPDPTLETRESRENGERSTSRARVAHYVPLSKPKKDSAGELFSPLGEQECNDFIKLNNSSEKPQRRESVLDRIEKEILRRENGKGYDLSHQEKSNPKDQKLAPRTDPEHYQRQNHRKIEVFNPDHPQGKESRNKSRSAHREKSSYHTNVEPTGGRMVHERSKETLGIENRGASRIRTKYYQYDGKQEQGTANAETKKVSARGDPQANKTPESGSKPGKREISPEYTKTDQVVSTEMMRQGEQHDSSGNLLGTMSPVHSSIRNSLKSKKQD